MFESHPQAVLEFLRAQKLDLSAFARIEADFRVSGRAPAVLAVEAGVFTRVSLIKAAAVHLGWSHETGLPEAISAELIQRLDPGLARLYGVIPLRMHDRCVDVLAADPFNPKLAADLEAALGCDVRLVLADPERIAELIRRHYGDEARPVAPGSGPTVNAVAAQASQAPVIRWVNEILSQAVEAGASDVHFEPFVDGFRVRQRVDGSLREIASPPRPLASPVIARLKVLANLNIAEHRVPQDGRLRLELAGRAVDLRVSTLPTEGGESVVLRVLDSSASRLELDALGLPSRVRAGMGDMLRRPNGIFVVTGPTGSGKTTTLYAALRTINTPGLKIMTVEDPVEYEIEGLMQVPVLPGIGRGFATVLRSFLRHDPDVIMVGEIRDAETAQVAIQAALTGHLVLTTLHTNDAPGAVARLTDMGVEPFLIASSLGAVLAQRLLRRICLSCRVLRPPTAEQREWLGKDFPESGDCFVGLGCADCSHTGYRGRLGLYEWMQMSEPLREWVARGEPALALKQQALAEGMTPLREAGIDAILGGQTSIDEVLRYT